MTIIQIQKLCYLKNTHPIYRFLKKFEIDLIEVNRKEFKIKPEVRKRIGDSLRKYYQNKKNPIKKKYIKLDYNPGNDLNRFKENVLQYNFNFNKEESSSVIINKPLKTDNIPDENTWKDMNSQIYKNNLKF